MPGRYGWNGAFGTHWFNDPAKELVGVLMIQRSLDEADPATISGRRSTRRWSIDSRRSSARRLPPIVDVSDAAATGAMLADAALRH